MSLLDDTRKSLSINKKGWMQKLDQLKKQIKDANEASKREHTKLQQHGALTEELKRKRDEMFLKYGLSVDDTTLRFENMPRLLQDAEKKYQDAIVKLQELKKSSAQQQDMTEKCVADFNKGSQDILE